VAANVFTQAEQLPRWVEKTRGVKATGCGERRLPLP
jgi:hypothetical protein